MNTTQQSQGYLPSRTRYVEKQTMFLSHPKEYYYGYYKGHYMERYNPEYKFSNVADCIAGSYYTMRKPIVRPSHFDTFRPSHDKMQRSIAINSLTGTLENRAEGYERVDYSQFSNEDRLLKKAKQELHTQRINYYWGAEGCSIEHADDMRRRVHEAKLYTIRQQRERYEQAMLEEEKERMF